MEAASPDRMRIEYVLLEDVARWPRNPKAHDLGLISASFDRFGYADPIILDETTGQLVAGHGRLETLQLKQESGERQPSRILTDSEGKWLVPVVRGVAFEDETEAEAFLLAHNQATIVGGWNQNELEEMLRDHTATAAGFGGMGWDPDMFASLTPQPPDLDALLSPEAPTQPEPEKAPQKGKEAPKTTRPTIPTPEGADEIPEIAPPRAKAGDVWALGKHRVMVGDSLVREDLDKLLAGAQVNLVCQDPPFAIYGSSTGIGADIADDKMIRPFFRAMVGEVQRLLPRFGHAYFCCDWRSWSTIWWAMTTGGLAPKNMIVWDKGDQGLGSSYSHCHELVAFCAKLPPPKAMKSSEATGQRIILRPNMQRYPRVTGEDRLHNAAKPVGMLVEFIQNSSDPGDRVLDMFCGSGSTLIGCDVAGRVCYTMDLDPKWVDVTIARWEKMTGLKAELLTSDGQPRTRRVRIEKGN